ncbi:hypothetical protein [Hymenobacter armeniacus]|uniref:DUF3471 domain-containing protein n=1 Tax=Hymenobacter armeniacus TaxID=2771358 RepID=A0ABR8JY26_9BACT|nr:hypothetical protein [Hymenobacter armeniacus]MBD2722649.1 hypothetical protein [Hymenobacter armeniacus]
MRILLSVAGFLWLLAPTAQAQTLAAPPTFYSTYTYTAYTVYDTTSAGPPTRVSGVGGTLTLRADGTYEKHLSIVASGSPHYFNQTGTFALAGDSIRFAFSDMKGADVQRGTFRFVPATRQLSITILGYPAGNRGVYDLVATPAKAPGKAPKPRAKAPARRK